MKKLFKKVTILVSCFAIALCGMALVACDNKEDTSARVRFDSTSEIYGFAALTTGMYLNSETASEPALATDDYATEVVNKVDGCIAMLDNIVGGKAPISSQKQDVEAEKATEYSSKIVVTTTDLTGESKAYNIYFNETELSNPQNKIDDPDECEVSTKLDGIIVIDNKEVKISGTKTVEAEWRDIEVEIEFKAYVDANTYVTFSQEFENGEEEYEYAYYKNGSVQKAFTFEMEAKNNKVEVELEIIEGSTRSYYEVEQIIINSTRYLEISYKEPNKTEVKNIRVSISTQGGNNVYNYMLPNGDTITR